MVENSYTVRVYNDFMQSCDALLDLVIDLERNPRLRVEDWWYNQMQIEWQDIMYQTAALRNLPMMRNAVMDYRIIRANLLGLLDRCIAVRARAVTRVPYELIRVLDCLCRTVTNALGYAQDQLPEY